MKSTPATAAEIQRFLGARVGHKRANLEMQLLRSVLDYLGAIGWTVTERRNVGQHEALNANGTKRFVRYGTPGQSDVWAITPHGLHVEIEIKTPGHGARSEPTSLQQAWLDRVRATKGIALCVTSIEGLIAGLQWEFEKRGLAWPKSWDL